MRVGLLKTYTGRGCVLPRRNRCLHDIVYDVLSQLREGPKRLTPLCTAANLPVDRGLKLLSALGECGLIVSREERGRRVYMLSELGYVYISLYEELSRISCSQVMSKELM